MDRIDTERSEQIPVRELTLQGDLGIPKQPAGLVIFAHGSGSSRLSPRNRHVAEMLRRFGLATLLFDLLTLEEEERDQVTGDLRFDIELLSQRLVDVTRWARTITTLQHVPLGYFGASTGAAAALKAAAALPDLIGAVVSRGGRPDLAGDDLRRVRAPVLLIVGSEDYQVITLNRDALGKIKSEKELAIVPRATHLFEEPGTLDEVSRLAKDWFLRHFRPMAA